MELEKASLEHMESSTSEYLSLLVNGGRLRNRRHAKTMSPCFVTHRHEYCCMLLNKQLVLLTILFHLRSRRHLIHPNMFFNIIKGPGYPVKFNNVTPA